MQKETERIWSPMDVRIAWIDSREAAAAAHDAGLTVMIEEAAYPAPAPDDDSLLASLTQPPDACGWGLAHLWVRHIERHAARARGGEHASTALPATMADMFLARALGRALAVSGPEAAALLEAAGIEPARRAETLSLPEWQRIFLLATGLS